MPIFRDFHLLLLISGNHELNLYFHVTFVHVSRTDIDPLIHESSFHSCVISAPVDVDLLDASNWTISNKIPFDPTWIPDSWEQPEYPCWLLRMGNYGIFCDLMRVQWSIVPLLSKLKMKAVVFPSPAGHALIAQNWLKAIKAL